MSNTIRYEMSILYRLLYRLVGVRRGLSHLTPGIGMPDYVFQMNLNQNKSPHATDIEA